MKFDIGSDLHLSFKGFERLVGIENPGSDVLVLAGDIIEVVDLKKSSGYRTRVINYFKTLNARYKKIIYIAGNHEHYGNSFFHTNQNLKDLFVKFELTNFVVLDNETVEVDDVIFFGATMWTTMRNENPIVVMDCGAFMNDYAEIRVPIEMDPVHARHYYGEYTCLQPMHTIAECRHTKRKINQFVQLKTDKKKVLVTHMAPCIMSVGENHRKSNVNDAYYEDISTVIFESDIKMAIHGHMHDPVEYSLGECIVVSNPRGYFTHESRAFNFKYKQVEV